METETYTIRHHNEETECDGCGWPLDIGDHATMSVETSRVYCCRSCAQVTEAPKHSAAPIVSTERAAFFPPANGGTAVIRVYA